MPVFMWYRTNFLRYIAKWGIAQMCLCETKYQGGISHYFGGVLTSLRKYRSDSIAVSRDMGPLSIYIYVCVCVFLCVCVSVCVSVCVCVFLCVFLFWIRDDLNKGAMRTTLLNRKTLGAISPIS